jgi:hypothetical protein
MRWARYIALMRQMRDAHNILIGKPERKIPLGRPRHR